METEGLLLFSRLPTIFPALNRINAVQTFVLYFFKVDCNIIFTFTSGSSK